jgi:hypothetical protein
MKIPARIKATTGRKALVDGIPFTMPVVCRNSPVLMAIFRINAEKAAKLLEGDEISPIRFHNTGLLVVTVIDYRDTVIGKYIEYSVAIACTHSTSPSKFKLPGFFTKTLTVGQYVVELPVSSEVSVKGGKGIWGMPKHQAPLDFKITDDKVSSQYDLDGKLCTYVEIERPASTNLPLKMAASNFCAFRGMLWKSDVYFEGKAGFCVGSKAKAKFVVGDHPRVQKLKDLEIRPDPLATAFIPSANGTLDDHVEGWFLTSDNAPSETPEGMESVINLGRGEKWPAPPDAPVPS